MRLQALTRASGPSWPGRTIVCLALVLSLGASACSTSEQSAPAPTTADAVDGEITSTTKPSGTTTSAEQTTTTNDVYGPLDYQPGIEELAFDAGEIQTTTTVEATTTIAEESSTTVSNSTAGPATTTGSGGGPVTTTGGGGGGDLSIYKGVLGALGRDEVVTAAVVPPPSVGPGILPLTGLPGAVPSHPAAVVKIDNGSRARPQSGLDVADIVVEEEVEGGITRFAAIFHSTSAIVGPIRSARTTDIGVLNGLGSPLLLYSGANQVTDTIIRAQPTVQNRNAGSSSGYWRNSSRRAPSNLYSDTAPHWASASGGPPPPQFAYRADGAAVPGSEAASFNVSYRASKASWSWDGTAWLRSQGGRAHTAASGQRISAANVVVIEAKEVDTGMVDSSGSIVPEFVYVGSGRATVFTAGKRIDGIWTRPTLGSVATLTTAEGLVIELTPGRTWIELIRADSGMLS